MAIGDEEMKTDSMHSLLNYLSSNLDIETLSPEDVAWADSCLNNDVDASDADWTSFKDALLEIISSQPDPPSNSSVGQSRVDEILHPREILTSVDFGGGSDKNEDLINGDFGEVESFDIYDDEYDEEEEDDDGNLVVRNKKGGVRGKILVDSVFRPNYSEEKVENPDFDLSSSLTTNDVGPSPEDIFEVWDLGISDEQDDFTDQLNKAFEDGPSQIQSIVDDSTALKDLMNVTIDDIISGIGDLSLKQDS